MEEVKKQLQKLSGEVFSQNSSRAIEIAATISIVKSTSGFLHAVNVGMLSNPTMTIFDNASGASGTVLLHVEPQGLGGQKCYLIDVSVVNGITAYLTGGNAPRLTLSYR